MALSIDEILALPTLHDHIQEQSASLIGMFDHDQRLSAVFATQQRWLMSHIGLSLHFRGRAAGPGLYLSSFLDAVKQHRVASRNTADAYIKELLKYKYITIVSDSGDRRLKPLMPNPFVIETFVGWLEIHLIALDNLAGGQRLVALREDRSQVAALQPLIAEGLLAANAVRNPAKTFSLFTWLDNGGLIMDWLITHMERASLDSDRVRIGAFSVTEMAERLNLSRTHLARKLKEAEDLGSIGWDGRRGHSVMWVSKGFRQEYAHAQAAKLSIIDHACEIVMQPAIRTGT